MYNVKSYRLLQLLLLLIFACLSSPLMAASASLSHSTTSLDQPVRLTISYSGEQREPPDLSALEDSFEILGRSKQQNVSIINGKMSASNSLVLSLLPRRTGELEIPAITIGNKTTNKLRLQVKQSQANSDQDRAADTFIKLSVDKSQVYLQQEVILTVRLFMPEGVMGDDLTTPSSSLPDTLIKLLSEDHYPLQHDGQNYQVLERRYALFAYQTGQLEIDGVQFRGRFSGLGHQSIQQFMMEPFSMQRPPARIVRATADKVAVEVMPPPSQFNGPHWLPAKNLQLVEANIGNAASLIAGKQITRRIMLLADGVTAAQLPAIEFNMLEGIKLYQERPKMKERVSSNGVSGNRENVITLVAAKPGSYTLPPLEVAWWNTETGKQELAKLPAIKLQVLADPTITTANSPVKNSANVSPLVEKKPTEANRQQITSTDTQQPATGEENNILIWLLAGAWLLTIIGWWLSQRYNRKQASAGKLPAPATPTLSGTTPKQILESLQSAYQDANLQTAQAAWLDWAKYRWPANPPATMASLAKRCSDNLAQAIKALDMAMYNPSNSQSWLQYDPVLLIKQEDKKTEKAVSAAVLPSLNPSV